MEGLKNYLVSDRVAAFVLGLAIAVITSVQLSAEIRTLKDQLFERGAPPGREGKTTAFEIFKKVADGEAVKKVSDAEAVKNTSDAEAVKGERP